MFVCLGTRGCAEGDQRSNWIRKGIAKILESHFSCFVSPVVCQCIFGDDEVSGTATDSNIFADKVINDWSNKVFAMFVARSALKPLFLMKRYMLQPAFACSLAWVYLRPTAKSAAMLGQGKPEGGCYVCCSHRFI